MAIGNSVNISSRVSPNLSTLIGSQVNNPDTEEPVTLGSVHDFITNLVPASLEEVERIHQFDIDTSLLDELNGLIEEYGEDVLAIEFVRSDASEPLSRVIEALVNDENREHPPTLDTVRQAIVSGLTAKLIGDGVLEDDEDDTLLSEIDSLIRRHGGEAMAEDFIRYD
jgi:hypothetical protein